MHEIINLVFCNNRDWTE